jgi:hypothetical protein
MKMGLRTREDIAVVLLGDADLGAGNDGARQRGAEQVAVLVDGVALDGTVDNVLDKLLLEVENHHLLGAERERLLLNLGPVLFLANVGQEADDLVALEDEPFEDRRGVETSAVSETNATLGHCAGKTAGRPGLVSGRDGAARTVGYEACFGRGGQSFFSSYKI